MEVLVWDPAIARPKNLDDALTLIEQLKTLPERSNPKFLALARVLLTDPAYEGQWSVDADRFLDDAKNCACAIWAPRTPVGDAMPAIRAVIRHADALGLIAYRDSRQAVFLPGGRTVTPLQKRLSDEDFEAYDARLAKRVAACRSLLEGFVRHFEPLGFVPGSVEPGVTPRFAALSFADRHLGELVRSVEDGWQRLVITVNDADADSEYLKCFVTAGVRRESVEAIFTRTFGENIRKPETFFFGPSHLLPGCPDGFGLGSERLSVELPALVARLAMPVLDLARDLDGLDEVMNDPLRFPFVEPPHPQAPQNLADNFVSFGRQSCLKTLIVSWLVRSANFENRVAALRAFVRTRVDVSEADLDLLVAGLRSSR
jgi:hypothetical protein